MQNETIIRKCFTAWQKRDWNSVESLLADDFTFTSPYDNHIDKHEYKQKCWNAVKEIEEYEYVTIMERGTKRLSGIRVE